MRLSYVLLVATATFLATQDAALAARYATVSSSTTNAVKEVHSTRRRHLKSYSMNDLESGVDGEEARFKIPIKASEIKEFTVRVQANQLRAQAERLRNTLNVDAVLRNALTRDQEVQRVAAYFTSHEGVLGGWLSKRTLDSLAGSTMAHKKTVFTEWIEKGKSLKDLTDLLKADEYVMKQYAGVVTHFKHFLQMPRPRM
uniref:RxLR effector protein n=1 Tax=Phytophthora sojae TaxID=67593 RepID=G1FRF3_PHYSO|nr:Avh114 [Phytophthora sojae]